MLKGIGIVGMSSLSEEYFASLTLRYLLGQGINLQPFLSDGDPTHALPLPVGGGFLQVRVFVCMPSDPHVLVQRVHAVHAVHCPSPERQSRYDY